MPPLARVTQPLLDCGERFRQERAFLCDDIRCPDGVGVDGECVTLSEEVEAAPCKVVEREGVSRSRL